MAVDLIARLLAMARGSSDAYTKAETDTLLAAKADLANGKIPAAQLPSYVDDTIEGYLYNGAWYEDAQHTAEVTGESGKIYVDLVTNRTYRWSGSAFVEISESLALGETSSTAYAGNKGKANADAIAAMKDGQGIDSFADVEAALASKANTADLGTAAAADTTTSITEGGTGVPTAGAVYADQQRQDAEIGSLVDRGAKNVFDIEGSTFTSKPEGTTTATKNADGSVLVNATDSGIRIANFTVTLQSGVAYNLSGCPSGGGISTYALDVRTLTNSQVPGSFDVGSGSGPFTVPTSGTYYICVRFADGYTAPSEGITFYPMICTAADYEASPAFQPYTPTNRELYEMILALQSGT